jgi:hypothetical protein
MQVKTFDADILNLKHTFDGMTYRRRFQQSLFSLAMFS